MKCIANSLHCIARPVARLTFCLLAGVSSAHAQDAASLRHLHDTLGDQLARNQFGRPLHLESSDRAGDLRGDVYAQIAQPFAVVGPALQGMEHWCDMLSLHMNVKSCRASVPPARAALALDIGRKFDQPLADAYPFRFAYAVPASTHDYLQVTLHAADGPLGTSRYRILLEATALDDGSSFLHLSYAYAYGLTARVAMQGYLATIGHAKIGFTVTGRDADGRPSYVGGTLGVIERNTMRYYLAIEAYLGALDLPPPLQREQRLADWYDGVERYPLQLHELAREEYLAMKLKELQRQ